MSSSRTSITTASLALALTLFMAAAFPSTAEAQRKMVMSVGGEGIEGQPFIIPELGAIVVSKNSALEVLNVMPEHARPKDYLSVDIKEGDILIMLNGSKLKSIEDLQTAHESLATGEELKFGVKRGKEMRLVKFNKADPAKFPKAQATTMTIDGSAGALDGKVAMLMGTGVVAKNSEGGGIEIAALMPDASANLGGVAVAEGDKIVSLQGTKITELKQLSDLFEKIAIGEEVTLVLANAKEEYTATFKKKKSEGGPGMMMIKK